MTPESSFPLSRDADSRRSPKSEEPRLVLVEWEDSFGCSSSWASVEHVNPCTLVCRSVGWLIHDAADCKVIVPHLTMPNANVERQGCGDMTIPTSAVRKLVPISVEGDVELANR